MYPFNTLLRSLEVLRRDTKPQGLIFLLYLFGVDYVVTLSTCSCKKVQETGRRSCGEGNDAQMCAPVGGGGAPLGFTLLHQRKGKINLSSITYSPPVRAPKCVSFEEELQTRLL